jgi:diguanylate cyclase (GGDEF)-like protein
MDDSQEDLREELRRARVRIAELEQLVNIDELVALGNRRALKQAFDSLRANWGNAGVTEKSASLALLDLVGLKDVNERLGYAEGDKVLVRFAQCLRRAFMIPPLGTPTVVTRLGGDEFVVLAAGAGRAETEVRLARLDDPDSLVPGETAGKNAAYTAAIVEFDSAETLDAIIARADQILIQQKRSRRAERRLVLGDGSGYTCANRRPVW